MQALFWDGTVISGQIVEPEVSCELRSHITVKVPVSMLQEYSQPPQERNGAEKK
jgi:hypothetical protein